MAIDYQKAPFPWFGGKSKASAAVWAALGDVSHYIEPFAGTLAVLLNRPHPCNRAYFSETVNDADGLLCNVWRSIQHHPELTAEWASWPVTECVPAGTAIATPSGNRAIEDLKPGDTVWCYAEGVGIVPGTVSGEQSRVVSKSELWRVGPLICTGNHPVWTPTGYIKAQDLPPMASCGMINKEVNYHVPRQDLSDLWITLSTEQRLAKDMRGSLFSVMAQRRKKDVYRVRGDVLDSSRCQSTLLLTELHAQKCTSFQPGNSQEIDGGGASSMGETGCSRKNESLATVAGKSDPSGGIAEKISRKITSRWMAEFFALWEGTRDSAIFGRLLGFARRCASACQRLERKISFENGACISSLLVSARYCEYRTQNECGDRREFSSITPARGTRPETGLDSKSIGMDHFAVQQSASNREYGGSDTEDSGSCRVFNIETTGGNYFANGVLVHNCDKHARQVALMRWREEMQLEHLMGDPDWCDPKMAGWWLYGICAHIGGGWCTGEGPWTADETGRLVKQAKPGKGQRRSFPYLINNGRGVHRPQLREPGVSRGLPHLGNNGMGVHHAGTREPGVLSNDPANEFHPLAMPELIRWFQWLSARLRHVRILNGDWRRVCTSGAAKMLEVRSGKGVAGFFLDPPYSAESGRDEGLYAAEDLSVAHAVREWCAENGNDPDYRIVLAGFDGEHNELEARGWRSVEWFKAGFLQGGYSQQKRGGGTQQHRERLWLSPHCLQPAKLAPMPLFADIEDD